MAWIPFEVEWHGWHVGPFERSLLRAHYLGEHCVPSSKTFPPQTKHSSRCSGIQTGPTTINNRKRPPTNKTKRSIWLFITERLINVQMIFGVTIMAHYNTLIITFPVSGGLLSLCDSSEAIPFWVHFWVHPCSRQVHSVAN